jgi:lipopolysaccharide transport system ATP-binding protein
MSRAANAIEIRGLTKRYRLGQQQGARLLSEAITAAMRRAVGRGRERTASRELFAALENVSFDVPHGQALGIVGINGAGKTTLLKLIARITRPSEGTIQLGGRVGSLLEVGTGFHPELTGRENVYLNGSMLGMRRGEIQRKFNDIVEFAEVARFIDTPVKRYSTGMYVRLAFAVAAHLEPEILLVDEVLAVGDVAFQRKCFGKMNDVQNAGRTILFVSHNLGAVQQLTSNAILLERGRLIEHAPTPEVVATYVQRLKQRSGLTTSLEDAQRPSSDLERDVELVHAELIGDSGGVFKADATIQFDVGVRVRSNVPGFRISFSISSYDGRPVGGAFSDQLPALQRGEEATFRFAVENVPLAPGRYQCNLATASGDNLTGYRAFDIVTDVLDFEVAPPQSEDGVLGYWEPSWGVIRLPPPRVTRC